MAARKAPPPGRGPGAAVHTSEIDLPADEPSTLTLDNQEAGVPHNIAIYTDESLAQVLFQGETITGPDTIDYDVPAIAEGEYYFHCDTHPDMQGTVVVAPAPGGGSGGGDGEGGGSPDGGGEAGDGGGCVGPSPSDHRSVDTRVPGSVGPVRTLKWVGALVVVAAAHRDRRGVYRQRPSGRGRRRRTGRAAPVVRTVDTTVSGEALPPTRSMARSTSSTSGPRGAIPACANSPRCRVCTNVTRTVGSTSSGSTTHDDLAVGASDGSRTSTSPTRASTTRTAGPRRRSTSRSCR